MSQVMQKFQENFKGFTFSSQSQIYIGIGSSGIAVPAWINIRYYLQSDSSVVYLTYVSPIIGDKWEIWG